MTFPKRYLIYIFYKDNFLILIASSITLFFKISKSDKEIHLNFIFNQLLNKR